MPATTQKPLSDYSTLYGIAEAFIKRADADRERAPLWAIAYAIIQHAEVTNEVAKALERMGMNGACGPGPGALENVGMQIEALAQAVAQIEFPEAKE